MIFAGELQLKKLQNRSSSPRPIYDTSVVFPLKSIELRISELSYLLTTFNLAISFFSVL